MYLGFMRSEKTDENPEKGIWSSLAKMKQDLGF